MTNPAVQFELSSTEPELFAGTSYRFLRRLASGGMGDLYLVAHRDTGRQWVAKVVHEKLAGDPQLLDRVRIEAQSLTSLRHPNVVSVVDFDTTSDNRPFIVMEYLQGNDLGRELASGYPFSLEELLEHADEALAGLGAAHDLGIIHRDLKPENLFLHDQGGGKRTLKILDFGVARIVPGTAPLTPSPLKHATGTGIIVGTLKYVSPEGAAGLAVDFRADVYSLGLVLYRMLAGRSPYGDDIPDVDLIALRLTQQPKPPSYFSPRRIAPQLDAIVIKALQLSPNDRFQTATEFREALRVVRRAALSYSNIDEPVPLHLSVRRGPTNKPLLGEAGSEVDTVVQRIASRTAERSAPQRPQPEDSSRRGMRASRLVKFPTIAVVAAATVFVLLVLALLLVAA